MLFWKEIEFKVEKYRYENTEYNLNDILMFMNIYLKTCATNSHNKAKFAGVFIPVEDFYSQYLMSCWQGIDDYLNLPGYKLKNIILRRLSIAEKHVWRMYKTTINVDDHKNDISYNSARWIELDVTLLLTTEDYLKIENNIYLREILKKYQQKHKDDYIIISLLLAGYSPSEVFKLLGLSSNYDYRERKQFQRLKESFHNFLNHAGEH